LGISRVTLSRLLNEKSAITPDMAIRLHKWLGRGPTPETWLQMQLAYDLWQVEQMNREYNVIPVKYKNEDTISRTV
ncbi:HigA family addiction module antitoxin, partial [Pasteurella atlantica]